MRYKKIHKTRDVIEWCEDHEPDILVIERTPFVTCMPDVYKVVGDPVASYRAYYIGDKVRFAKWAPRAHAPGWWPLNV
jgi:hypothetical protein